MSDTIKHRDCLECDWYRDIAEYYGYQYVGEYTTEEMRNMGYYPIRQDSPHKIYKLRCGENVEFQDEVELHRFSNRAGVPYSTITVNRFELMNNPRPLEYLIVLSAYMRYAVGKHKN